MARTPTKRAPATRRSKAVEKAPTQSLDLTVDELVTRGQETMRQIVAHEDKPRELYVELADTLIALRTKFISPGRDFPDWKGRNQAYREAAAAVYSAAEIPPDSESAIQARIRYVVANRLRELAPPEQLEELGYKKHTPAESAKARRKARKALDVEGPTLQPAGGTIETRAQAFQAMTQLVEQVVWEMPVPGDGEDYVAYMQALTDHTKLCEQLWALHERRRSNRRNTIELSTTYVSTRTKQPSTPEEMRELRQALSMEARILSAPTPTAELAEAYLRRRPSPTDNKEPPHDQRSTA